MPWLSGDRPAAAESGSELVTRSCVQHVGGLEPRAAGNRHAPAKLAKRSWRVRVGVDDDLHSLVAREPGAGIVQIEAIDLAVDFDGDPRSRRGNKDPVH